jgi:nitrogen fixation protein FixH
MVETTAGARRRETAEAKTAWRFFPLAVALALGFVAIVNAFMITQALGTFPGIAGSENGYDLSNAYNKIISAEAAQNALGWKLVVFGKQQHLVVRLADRDGAPISGLTVTATAIRPVGPESRTKLNFDADAPGHWVATRPLDLGQWLVDLHATAPDRNFVVTRRVIIR